MNSPDYPENRLNILIDQNGNVSFRQDEEFLKYYTPTAEEMEEELEDLEYQLEMKLLDEPCGPFDMFDTEYDDWKDELRDLRERIRELKESLQEKQGEN